MYKYMGQQINISLSLKINKFKNRKKILKMEPRVLSFELQGVFEAWVRGCLLTVPLNIATMAGKLHILMALCYHLKAVRVQIHSPK